MSAFSVYNHAGEIQWSFACPDFEDHLQTIPLGMGLYKGETEPGDTIDVATGSLVKGRIAPSTPHAPDPAYVRARKAAYPSVQEQLDWLWHAMDRGDMSKVEPFYGHIKAVKTNFPKEIDMSDHGESIEL
jgi:hypothetical protein